MAGTAADLDVEFAPLRRFLIREKFTPMAPMRFRIVVRIYAASVLLELSPIGIERARIAVVGAGDGNRNLSQAVISSIYFETVKGRRGTPAAVFSRTGIP